LRNPLTDTPDWRYGTARAELDREEAGLPVYDPCDDEMVEHLKQLLPLRNTGYGFVDPDLRATAGFSHGFELAIRIYEDQSAGGMRDIMEAALLTYDATMDFFNKNVSRWLDESTILLYRHLFYDIDMDKDLKFWVQRNLFVPNKCIQDREKFNSAYMWKVVAYHGGVKFLTQYAIDGIALEENIRTWMRSMGVSEYVRQVLKSSHSYAKLLDSAGTPAMAMTATWDKQENSNETAGEEKLLETANAIHGAISPPDQEEVSEDEILHGQKYSDDED
jgi:hypothetical protein